MKIFGIPVFPDQASTFARDVDALYFFILAVCSFFALVVAVAVIYFGIRYRRTHEGQIGARIEGNLPLELLWSVIPTIIAMVMFGWGASVFFHLRRPPAEAMHIYAVGKQWMWKFQHREGQREINTLHVPVNTPVRLILTSEDVLHDVFLEAWQKAASYSEERGTVGAWLSLRARSRAIDRRRSAPRNRAVTLEALGPEGPVDPALDPARIQDQRRLSQAFAVMSAEEQQVIVLGYFEGLTSSEIAEQLGTPVGTVKSRTRSALVKLRGALGDVTGVPRP